MVPRCPQNDSIKVKVLAGSFMVPVAAAVFQHMKIMIFYVSVFVSVHVSKMSTHVRRGW